MRKSDIPVLGTSIVVHLALVGLMLLAITPVGERMHPVLGAALLLCSVGVCGYLKYRRDGRVAHWVWLAGPTVAGLVLSLVSLVVVYRLAFPPGAVPFRSFVVELLTDPREGSVFVVVSIGVILSICLASLAGSALGRLATLRKKTSA